jgi:hypothetical protein
VEVEGPWEGRGRAVGGPRKGRRGVAHCDKVDAAVLVLVVAVCVGGARGGHGLLGGVVGAAGADEVH